MTFGVTPEGFVLKRLSDIKAEIESEFREAFGDNINLTPDTEFGKIIGMMSSREALIWELAQIVYANAYPDGASGRSLDGAVALTGARRKEATPSVVTLSLLGTNGKVVNAGTLFGVSGTGNQFATDVAVTLSDVSQSITSITNSGLVATATKTAHGYVVDQVVYIAGASPAVYNGFHKILTVPDADTFTYALATDPGMSASGTITARTTTSVEATATVDGPVYAGIGTVTVVVNASMGLQQSYNADLAEVGTNVETDPALLTRRDEDISIVGAGTVNAILARIRALAAVKAASLVENATDATDSDGRPSHSFETVVQDGDEQTIGNEIFNVKGAGIETVTTATGPDAVTVTVDDSEGQPHTIEFSRPTGVDVYVDVTVTYDDNYPVNGDDLVAAAILAYGDTLEVGDDVIPNPYMQSALIGIPGIINAVIKVGESPSPVDDYLVISRTALALFDAGRITVLSSHV